MSDDPKIGENRLPNRGNAGKGRPQGSPNKLSRNLKASILGALEAQGGQAYLEKVAAEDPRTFCALLGKILPTTLEGDPDNPVVIETTIAREIMATIAAQGRFDPMAPNGSQRQADDE